MIVRTSGTRRGREQLAIWFGLPLLGLLLVLTFAGFPFGGPLGAVVYGLVAIVSLAGLGRLLRVW